MNSIDFSKKSLVFITGSSRGIGRAIAVEISKLLHPESTLVLIASSQTLLEETKTLVSKVKSTLNIIVYPLDLSKPSETIFDKLFEEVTKKTDVSNLEYSVVIHNAGTVGSLRKTIDLSDVDLWRKYYDLNLVSTVSLNSKFVSKTKDLAKKLVVINVTSLCSSLPFVNMSMYGSCKAARNLFFRVLAEEEKDIVTLNYSPGPVDTDMFNTVVETAQDDELRSQFKKTKDTCVLTPQMTVEMLLNVLKKGDFNSGDLVDYFDRVPK